MYSHRQTRGLRRETLSHCNRLQTLRLNNLTFVLYLTCTPSQSRKAEGSYQHDREYRTEYSRSENVHHHAVMDDCDERAEVIKLPHDSQDFFSGCIESLSQVNEVHIEGTLLLFAFFVE